MSAQPDFVRISGVGGCELQIAHRMIGTPESRRGPNNSIAMKMGTALEPVINEEMERNGALVYFGTGFQIELGYHNPEGHYLMRGHPDGFISLGPNPSSWLLHELPRSALEVLTNGGTMLWEVKTMNDTSWHDFVRHGLSANALLTKYYFQLQGYLGSLRQLRDERGDVSITLSHVIDPATHSQSETVQSFSFMDWLDEQKLEFPAVALICGFNTATKKFAFRTVEFDPVAFQGIAERSDRILTLLSQGDLPEPTYDGRSTECYFCGFAGLCPAVKETMALVLSVENEVGIDAITTMAPTMTYTMEEIDEAMDLYTAANQAEAEAKAIKKAQREIIAQGLSELGGGAVRTEKYRARYSEVKGRRTIDLDMLNVLMDQAMFKCPDCHGEQPAMEGCEDCAGSGLVTGMAIPYRRGEGSVRLTIAPLYGQSYDDAAKEATDA